jgi:glycosyltransferase involved in cell wall biosynthesis
MGERAASRERRLKVVTLVRMFGEAGGGGAERIARELLAALDADRFDRMLCVSRPPAADDPTGEPIEADLRRRGVRVQFLSRRFKYDPFAWWPLLRLLRRERVDVLHAHTFGHNAWATVLGRLAGVGVVVAHEHNWAFAGRPLRPFVDRRLIARGSDAIIVVSEDARRKMIEVERIPPDRLVVLPNGVPAMPPGNGHAVRAELAIGRHDPVIGVVCVMRPEKAVGSLVRAAALLLPEVPRLRVVVAGDGPDRPAVQALARELDVADRVHLLGDRMDVPDILAALDVAVLCSDYEGIPLALLEYMDAARPIVATRVGGIPELIEDGVDGLLVPPRDPPALAEAILALLRDPERAAAMGARARERCRREFSVDASVERLQELYERLDAARRGAAGSAA